MKPKAADEINEKIPAKLNEGNAEQKTARVVFDSLALSRVLERNDLLSPDVARRDIKTRLEKVNTALENSTKESRIELATELLNLFIRGGENEVKDVLGDVVKLRSIGGRNAMYTVSGNGEQLRVWYSKPGTISRNHVDSCGIGMLFGVYGPPGVIEQYLEAFLGVYDLAEAKGPEGSRIFVGFTK